MRCFIGVMNSTPDSASFSGSRSSFSRRRFLQLSAATGAVALTDNVFGSGLRPFAKGRKPNLLFIMTDQQRFDALGANGNKVIQTPNMDRIAKSGVNLQHYFVNSPVCVPSRATLFSGINHGGLTADERLNPAQHVNLFRALKHSGYSIGYAGKNHLLQKEEWANFDYSDRTGENHVSSGPEEDKTIQYRRDRGALLQTEGCWSATFHDRPAETTLPYTEASSAIHFLESVAKKDTPFAFCLSFEDPHTPHIALQKFESMYPLSAMQPAETQPDDLDGKARRFRIKWEAQGSAKASDEDKRRYMAVYYAMITWVDEQIGRVMETLKRLNLENDTIIVFTTDHGDFCTHHGMCKKDIVLLDDLMHVPFLISWPGRLASQVVKDTFVEEVDVMPTLLDLMGVEKPATIQGKSFAPLLRGETLKHKDVVFGEICGEKDKNPYPNTKAFREAWEKYHGVAGYPVSWSASFNVPGDFSQSMRTSKYKYIVYPNSNEEEFYDLEADPGEVKNLAGDARYTDIKKDMRQHIIQWRQQAHTLRSDGAIAEEQRRFSPWLGSEPKAADAQPAGH